MLYITYNPNDFSNDGLGAQYQRMIAIIALCLYCKSNIEYLHTPMTKIEHIHTEEEVQQIEEYFGFAKTFKNTIEETKNIHEIVNVTIVKDLNIIIELSKKSQNKNILLKTAIVYPIVEKYIHMYENAMVYLKTIRSTIEPALTYFNKPQGQNVAVHIRRGDVIGNSTNIDIIVRFMPADYFKQVILKLQNEDPTRNFYIFTELTVENKHEFDIFRNIHNLEIISDNNTLSTFHHLANADILVTCKSSFSYISAFYNSNVVYYLPFWHPKFTHWIKL